MSDIDFSKIDLSPFIQPKYSGKDTKELAALSAKDRFAAYELGARYKRERDWKNAYKYYTLASDLGHKGASMQIALIYNEQKQYKKAARFFKTAIDQTDDVEAYVYLAQYYILGKIGMPFGRNKKGVRYLLVAAQRGQAKAQFLLAIAYRDGCGIHKDIGEYVFWMRCAQLNGNPQAIQYIKNAMNDSKYTQAWESMLAEADRRATQHDEYFAVERLTKEIMKSDFLR